MKIVISETKSELGRKAAIQGAEYISQAIVQRGHANILRALLIIYADPNVKDNDSTALHHASCHGRVDVVNMLLQNRNIWHKNLGG